MENHIERHELYTIDHSKDQHFKVVHMGYDTVIYEGGWWMKRRDYDKCFKTWGYPPTVRLVPDPNVVLSRNDETHQITISFLPAK